MVDFERSYYFVGVDFRGSIIHFLRILFVLMYFSIGLGCFEGLGEPKALSLHLELKWVETLVGVFFEA